MAGLITNIRNWLSSTSKEAPASPGEGKYGSIIGTQSYAFGGFATFSNQPAKQVDQYAGWVRVCVNFLANQVGRVPVAARVTDTEDRKAYKKALRNYYETKGLEGSADRPERRQFVPATIRLKSIVGGHLTNEDDLEYLQEDHPLIRLLRDPNGPQTGQQFWPLFMTYYYLVGRAYIWAPKGEDGLPKALWVLPAHWVQPFASQDSDRLRDYYEVRSQFSPEPVRFDADEVIEFGDWHPSNPLVPDSPVAGAAHEIDVHAMIRIAQYQGLQNGADIGGTLELPPEADPSDPNIARWLSSFQSAAQGIYNFGKPMVLLPGTKYTPRDAAKEVADYQAQLFQALASGNKELAKIAETMIKDSQHDLIHFVNEATQNAPAGTEPYTSVFKTSFNNALQNFELIRAAMADSFVSFEKSVENMSQFSSVQKNSAAPKPKKK